MKLRVLGCHGGTSLHHRNVSLLVDERVALDAGSLASATTVDEQVRIAAVLLTHSHLDHVVDLGAVCDVRAQHDCAPLRILGSPATIEALTRHFFNDVIWPDFSKVMLRDGPTIVLEAFEPELRIELSELGGLTVRPVPVAHSVPSCGFLVADEHASFVYTGDTAPTDRIWELAEREPNLRAVITEASFPARMESFALKTGHMTTAMAWERLRGMRARPDLGLFVYGMKPAYAQEIEDELLELTGGAVRPLVAGEVLELGDDRRA